MQATQNSSEVARLLTQVKSEFEAARLGLSGLASGTAKHRFLIKRQENIAELHKKLRGLVGDRAIELVASAAESPQIVGDRGQDDPELAAIATQLHETAQYASSSDIQRGVTS